MAGKKPPVSDVDLAEAKSSNKGNTTSHSKVKGKSGGLSKKLNKALDEQKKLEEKVISLETEIFKANLQMTKMQDDFKQQVSRLEKKAQERINEVRNKLDTQKEREVEEIKRFNLMSISTDIVKALINFELVLQHVDNYSPEVQGFCKGFQMIVNQLQNDLKKDGIRRIIVKVGDEVNYDLHEAVETVDDPAFNSGQICAVLTPGYTLNGRLVCATKVRVKK